MEDTQNQQGSNATLEAAGQNPNPDQDKTATNAAAGERNTTAQATPTSAEVADNAEAIQEHIDQAKGNFAEVEKAVSESPAAEHQGVRGALTKMRDTLEHLVRHAAHVVGVAKAVPATQTAAPAEGGNPAVVGAVAPASRATSDAHLNTGNGGPVTGNPGASYTQASAAQVAVDQGAPIPGVAKVPQPDVAVR